MSSYTKSEVLNGIDVVLYLRYSSDRQNEQSIEGQLRVCKQYCESNGYNIVDMYIDRATSAFHDTDKRLEFQRMIKDSDKQLWKGVVVYKLDRFARNRYDSATYKAKLKKNCVRVISATENISENPEGVILESVLEGMAEFYSKELSQKVTRGMNETALKCHSCGGHIPLGYKVENKKFVIDPVTAPIVKEAFEMYAIGTTIAEICEEFNLRGYRTAKGAEFNKNSFNTLFKNERYIGIYKYKDIRIENGVPAIIDKDLFNSVQKRLALNAASPGRSKAVVDYLLSGKIFCGHCGKPMTGECGTSHTGAKHYYYTCSGRKRLHSCKKRPIPKDHIEQIVAAEAIKLLTPENIEFYAAETVKAHQAEIQNNSLIPIIEQQIRDTEKSIKNLLKMVEAGAISETLAERLNELEKEKKAAEKRLVKEQDAIIELDKDKVIFWLSQYLDGDVSDPEFRRHIVDTMVNTVFVYDTPDGDNYELDIGFNISAESHAKVTLSDISAIRSDLAVLGSPVKTKVLIQSFSLFLFC